MHAKVNSGTDSRRTQYCPARPADAFIVPILKEYIEKFFDELEPDQGDRVLDVGCGRQPFRKKLEAKGYRYFGLDMTQNPENSVDFLCCIDQSLPEAILRVAPFQVVLCTEVLEHVADWEFAFSNLYNLISNDGLLFITCPHFYPLHDEPYDYWRPTPHVINFFANKFNFSIQYQINAGSALDVLGTLLGNIYFQIDRKGASDYILLYTLKIFRRLVFAALKSNLFQRRINSTGFYLSNIILIKKESR